MCKTIYCTGISVFIIIMKVRRESFGPQVGAFIAGLMLSGPEHSERTLRQVSLTLNPSL
jgi:hypothetical protein